MPKLSKDYNLEALYPDIANEWHPTKNDKLTPSNVTPGSTKKIFWKCSKNHIYESAVNKRTKRNQGCPYCSNRKIGYGNDLASNYPELAKEWHPTKNGELTPDKCFPAQNKYVYWKCKFGHTWKSSINNRNYGKVGCPYCSGKKIGYGNDLASNYPELAKEWHPTKNGKLTSSNVTPASNKKVWWLCKYGHEWQAVIGNRKNGNNCYYCSPHTSRPELFLYSELKYIFNNTINRHRLFKKEVDIFVPELELGIEYDGAFYHSKKNDQDRKKRNFFQKKGVKIYGIRIKPLKKILNHDIIIQDNIDHYEMVALFLNHLIKSEKMNEESHDKINKYLSYGKQKNEKYYNKQLSYYPGPRYEDSLAFNNPELAKEWHPTKNGKLKPSDFSKKSAKKVWWLCKKGHEFQHRIDHRNRSNSIRGCPYCSNFKVGYGNDFLSKYPELAKELHPKKNGDLNPSKIIGGSQKVWWICSKKHDFLQSFTDRKNGRGCPYCSNKLAGYENTFAQKFPNLIHLWHPTKNGDLAPDNVTFGSGKKVWWKCEFGHEWKTVVKSISSGSRCPECFNIRKKTNT